MLFGLHFFSAYVAAAGGNIGDIAGPIIVFIVIAVQLMRAARTFSKNKPGGQRPQAQSQPSSSPEDDLRDFPGGLSGESKPTTVSVPIQPVIPHLEPQSTPSPAQSMLETKMVITRQTPAKPTPIVALPVPLAPTPVPVKAIVPHQATRPAGSGRRLSDVVGRLGSRHLLREAIMLREILGPPLGERPRPPIA
jgi:hypothetical protein